MPKESMDAYNDCHKRGRDDDAPDTFGNDLYYGGNQEIVQWQASETGNLVYGAVAGHPNPTMSAKSVKARPAGRSRMQKTSGAHGDIDHGVPGEKELGRKT